MRLYAFFMKRGEKKLLYFCISEFIVCSFLYVIVFHENYEDMLLNHDGCHTGNNIGPIAIVCNSTSYTFEIATLLMKCIFLKYFVEKHMFNAYSSTATDDLAL